jgi:undecaprenyl-diphosphatase
MWYMGQTMTIWQLMVLAVVQGLTEFLPVSSTAHLAVIPRLFHWQDPGLAFDVALHVGTLIAVLIYFAPTWNKFVRAVLQRKRFEGADAINHERSIDRRLGWFVIVATIPAMISGVLLQRAAETSMRTLPVMGAMMVIVGILMWTAERFGSFSRPLSAMNLSDSLSIGIAQAFAVIPGVSRSGSTIAAGIYRGMDRDSATRFSFLLSTPIIAGAAVVEGHHLWKVGIPPEMRLPIVLAILLSGVTGYLSIWGMIRYVRVRSLMVFVIYRLAAGTVILAMWYAGLV